MAYTMTFFNVLLFCLSPLSGYLASARPFDGLSSFRAVSLASTTRLLVLMPPSARWTMGQGDALRSDCQEQSAGEFCWEPDILECDYLLSTRIFELLATEGESTISLWLPKLDHEQRLDSFVKILNENSERLGGLEVKKSSWPQVPATRVELTRTDETSLLSSKTQSKHENEASIRSSMQNTEQWVEDVLCGLSLCPYTKSMERAAVGLESVGIEEGPIEIRHSLDIDNDLKGISPPPAVVLATAFWQGVKELAQKSEKDVATLLIIAPPYFDDEFFEFSATFNKFLEPTIQATGAESIVGRAIFHPTYNSELIGHDTVLPGHALPVNMVGGFMDQYLVEENSYATKEKPDLSSIAKANDAVRWTPHATINLLRRSQLQASKEAEAASPNKRPNWIYARNVLRILKSDFLSSSQS